MQAVTSGDARPDRIERLRFGERWLPDAWETFHVPGGFGVLLVDMTQTKKAMRILRDAKIPATIPHLIVRAVGLAYLRNPEGFQIVCNYRRLLPGSLNVGLSMAGQTTYAPVVVLPAVDRNPLSTLIPLVIDEVDAAAAREEGDLKTLYRWVIPFRWLRLWILRMLHRNLKFRLRLVGHFQVTCLSNVDMVVPLVFYSSAILGVGSIRDRMIVVDGTPVVRPTVWLSGVGDHASSDGVRGGDAMQTIKTILEGEELVNEAREAAAAKAKARDERSLLLGEPQPARDSQQPPTRSGVDGPPGR
jgi:hypothetical protein